MTTNWEPSDSDEKAFAQIIKRNVKAAIKEEYRFIQANLAFPPRRGVMLSLQSGSADNDKFLDQLETRFDLYKIIHEEYHWETADVEERLQKLSQLEVLASKITKLVGSERARLMEFKERGR